VALLVAPIVIAAIGIVIERTMLSRLYKLDHLYGLLLTFGLALMIQGVFTNEYGSSGQPYRLPRSSPARTTWASCSCRSTARGSCCLVVVCFATWYVIERTKLGSYLRAGDREPHRRQGVRHQRAAHDHADLRFGVGLAAFAGVMAAPIYQVSPQMGANLIIVVFAVVVIGGMGSIMGSILTGFGLGVVEG
jgi:branched-chain amino acid transport system permease protein